jgi:basic amino acid/polyamine antiporter, APA family
VKQPAPLRAHLLSVPQASAMLIGAVVGIGIFKTPPIVAANSDSAPEFIALWVLGGVLTLIGALCYAELGSANPSSGGEYHYITRAYGRLPGFLFGWGRMSVMQSGAIAAVAFVYGDYAAALVPLGGYGPALHAAIAIVALTVLQLRGTTLSGLTQLGLTLLTVAGVLLVAAAAFLIEQAPAAASAPAPSGGAAGLALVFILLTYGGWSETAYLSGELRDVRRNLPRVLVIGTLVVTALYAVANLALIGALGLAGLRQAETVISGPIAAALGPGGSAIVSVIVCITALSTLNATIFTGARSIQALGRNFPPFAGLAGADASKTPAAALLAQGGIVLGLIAFGATARDGFTAMVEYTAPVFWSFLLLVGISLFLFRWREPAREIPFRVPLYPVTPILFCATSAYLLYSSLVYTGAGALVGVAILAAGVPLYLLGRGASHAEAAAE